MPVQSRRKAPVTIHIPKPALKSLTPAEFLAVVNSGDKELFELCMQFILNLSSKEKKTFSEIIDQEGCNALILAAKRSHISMISAMLKAKFEFDWTFRDTSKKDAFDYLLQNGDLNSIKNIINEAYVIGNTSSINPEFGKRLATLAPSAFVSNTIVSKKRMGDFFTSPVGRFTKSGRIPKTQKTEIPRPNRTFAGEREKQVLRHVATQFFFGFKDYLSLSQANPQLTEVQIMHMNMQGRHNLFIAANEHSVSAQLVKFLTSSINPSDPASSTHLDIKKLQQTLTVVHEPSHDKEGEARSLRYSRKLKNRVFNDDPENKQTKEFDEKQRQNIAALLRNGQLTSLSLEYESNNQLSKKSLTSLRTYLQNSTNTIFLVVIKNCQNKARHAEEFLSDIVDCARNLSSELNESKPYTTIAGKKRPCMGCFGRMDGVIDNFGKHPGRYWSHTGERQSNDVARKTGAALLSQFSHVSLSKNGKQRLTDYDSGSDSESEDRMTLRKK